MTNVTLFERQNKHSEVKVCGRASSLVHQKTIPPGHILDEVNTHVSLNAFATASTDQVAFYGKRDFWTIDGED